MERMWMLMIVSAAGMWGCTDIIRHGDPNAEGWSLPAPEVPAEPDKVDIVTPPHHTVVVEPAPGEGCAEPSMIGQADLDHDQLGNPVVAEVFGADGCLDERWIREWDGELPLREVYDFFDEEIARYVYVQPYPYTHIWDYDGTSRVVTETRTTEDASMPFFVEQRTYDGAGRLVELARTNDIWTTWDDDTTYQETWTFHPSNDDEFESHVVLYNGEVSYAIYRTFDHRGELVEEYGSTNGHDQFLVRRNTRDAAGQLVGVETWDRYTGAPETRATIERRADGTMLRKTEKNLRLGWLNVWEYDSAEREVLYTQDETEDGSIEYRQVHRYDAAGNVVFESTEYDFDRPQTRYSQTVLTFDERGRLLEQVATEVWMRGDSQRLRREYDDDGEGFLSTLDILNRDGHVIRTQRVERWHDAQRKAWEEFDNDHDGVREVRIDHRWDGERPLEMTADYDGDGALDVVEQWHYDAAGQLAERLVDNGADGVADHRELYQR